MTTRFAVLLLLFIGSVGHAKGDGFSIQVGLNYAWADTVALGGHNLELDTPPTLRDTFSGPSFRTGINYAFNDWASVELGYAQFASVDKYNAHFVEFVCPGVCEGAEGSIVDNVDQSGHAQWAAFVASRPYRGVDFFGKIGIGQTTIESVQVGDRTNRLEESDTQLILGIGLGYPLSDRVGLRLELEAVGSAAVQTGVSVALSF